METKSETSTLSTPDLCLLLEGTGTLQMSALRIEIFKTTELAFPMTAGKKNVLWKSRNDSDVSNFLTIPLFVLRDGLYIHPFIHFRLLMVRIQAGDGFLQQNLKAKNSKAYSSLVLMIDRTDRYHMPAFIAWRSRWTTSADDLLVTTNYQPGFARTVSQTVEGHIPSTVWCLSLESLSDLNKTFLSFHFLHPFSHFFAFRHVAEPPPATSPHPLWRRGEG